jgi:hypothetical protein
MVGTSAWQARLCHRACFSFRSASAASCALLFVGTAIGKISVGDVLRTIWPFYLAVLAVLLVVAFVPTLSTPNRWAV